MRRRVDKGREHEALQGVGDRAHEARDDAEVVDSGGHHCVVCVV